MPDRYLCLSGFFRELCFLFSSSSNRHQTLPQTGIRVSCCLHFRSVSWNKPLILRDYVVKALYITNTTEPLNLTIGPFLYLFIKRTIDQSDSKKEWIHFILFLLYLGYMFTDYLQPDEYKYNSYLNAFHPDWPRLAVQTTIPDDPLNIKKYLNLFTAYTDTFLCFNLPDKGYKEGRTVRRNYFQD